MNTMAYPDLAVDTHLAKVSYLAGREFARENPHAQEHEINREAREVEDEAAFVSGYYDALELEA